MSAEDVITQVVVGLKRRHDLDPTVVKSVIDTLLTTGNAAGSVDALESQLYTIAMRRAEKK